MLPANAEPYSPSEVEVAHILFIDIVGWSRLVVEDQVWHVGQLNDAVRETPEFQEAFARKRLIYGPRGDGMFLVFFDNPERAVRCAVSVTRIMRRNPHIDVRMGVNTGLVSRVRNIDQNEDVAGGGTNMAARVMDCGDAGHILLTSSTADLLLGFREWRPKLHDLGECEVKHGVKLRVYNLYFDDIGNPNCPAKLSSARSLPEPPSILQPTLPPVMTPTVQPVAPPALTPASTYSLPSTTAGTPKRVVLLYKRHAQQDEYLVKALENSLSERGHTVVVDRHLIIGVEWFEGMKREIRAADAVIVLLSSESISSEMISLEVEMADEARQETGGKPQILPVRMKYEGRLPEPLAHILDPIEYKVWQGPQSDTPLFNEVEWALHNPNGAVVHESAREVDYESSADSEPTGGPVPIGSKFYVERNADRPFLSAIARRREGIILVKGPRQIGKTSLLARGLNQARDAGAMVVITDFQRLNRDDLKSLSSFYLALGRLMARQMQLQVSLEALEKSNAPNSNFEEFLEKQIFAQVTVPILWGLDEVDRLFDCPFGTEIFSLFRSWHNDRQISPFGPWSNLCQVICYATEAHLFISDLNQSPFNVGLHIQLHDFSEAQVADLNGRYGRPLRTDGEITGFYRLLGGHPYLVRRGLSAMNSDGIGFSVFAAEANREDGPFDDHLHRIVVLLDRDPELAEAVKAMLKGNPCTSRNAFYRLRTAGVITGDSAANASLRSALYSNYLSRHMLG